jgi:hypothetical protein
MVVQIYNMYSTYMLVNVIFVSRLCFMSLCEKRLPSLRDSCRNLCRPYGTRYPFPLYQALKRWAKLSRPAKRDWGRPNTSLAVKATIPPGK